MMASQPMMLAGPRRPRLSLKINALGPAVFIKPTRRFPVDPTDPTAFNTLSNAYVAAIERSTPAQAEPLTAIDAMQSASLQTPVAAKPRGTKLKLRVPTPCVASYPATPVTARSSSPPPQQQQLDIGYPSTMTPTPPMSAGAVEPNGSNVFSFSPRDISSTPNSQATSSPVEPRPSRRHTALCSSGAPAPYTHPRSLRSILRNSPLPPRTAVSPSPRRHSLRLQEKAAKRVGYNNPLTQTITTNKYVKSHIDLLVEEASPASATWSPAEPEQEIDLMQAFAANEIQDGGQTPGPFEDMRRRLAAGLGAGSPCLPAQPGGVRKRKKGDKEKKRQWVWTIGVNEDDGDEQAGGGAAATLQAEAVAARAKASCGDREAIPSAASAPEIQPMPETPSAIAEGGAGSTAEPVVDVVMSDLSSVASEDDGLPLPGNNARKRKRDTPIPELAEP